MCGITGIASLIQTNANLKAKVEQSLACLAKRGPDHQGLYQCDNVILGHRRLSIIDTSASGNQPFTDSSGRYTIVFNGEFFNYKSHRKYLLNNGIKLHSNSDTEVLLQLFIHSGIECLQKVNGFFAFAIYDSKEKTLTIARDRIGIKPLYYFSDETMFCFSSEMKALVELGIPRNLDRTSLVNYLQLNYIPGPYSIFQDVQKLKPGHYIQLNLNQNHNPVAEQPYYRISTTLDPTYAGNYTKASNKLRELLMASAEKRMISDVPLGAFLSGGVDSSVIVSLASQFTNKLQTFSIGYKDEPLFDETQFAELVAKKYNTEHTVFSLSNDDIFNNLSTVLEYTDEPFADSSALAVNILSMHTSKQVKVSLSGDGGDELFAGYNKHRAEWMIRNRPVYNFGISALSSLLKPVKGSRNSKAGNFIRQIHRYTAASRLQNADRYWRLCAFIDEVEVDHLIDFQYDEREYFRRKRDKLMPFGSGKSINDFLLMDVNMVLQDDMLVKVDMNSMCHSLEVRVPFLDHELVDFAFSLPDHFKINSKGQKMILKDAFRHELPAEIFDRPKHGFEVPLLKWFQGDLKTTIENEWLNKDFLEHQGLFNLDEITNIKSKLYSSDPGDTVARMWGLIVFQYWWKKYMD